MVATLRLSFDFTGTTNHQETTMKVSYNTPSIHAFFDSFVKNLKEDTERRLGESIAWEEFAWALEDAGKAPLAKVARELADRE